MRAKGVGEWNLWYGNGLRVRGHVPEGKHHDVALMVSAKRRN